MPVTIELPGLFDLPGSYNARDLGGYPTRAGGTTKRGQFLRSGSLAHLTDAGQDELVRRSVTTVIDLRAHREAEERPDRLDENRFLRHHVPLLDALNAFAEGRIDRAPDRIEDMYAGLLTDSAASFARVFSLLAAAQSGVLFHCTAGKDRTGLTAMLLLAMAEVPDEIIVADYECSVRLLPPPPKRTPAFPAYAVTSPPDAMWETLDLLQSRWGGAREYLLTAGASPGELDSLMERFV